jgi:transposase InsO family protein
MSQQQLMRTLNNIFYNDEILPEFRKYLQNKRIYTNPDYLQKFRQVPFKNFDMVNNRIVYLPKSKNLIVIENEEQKLEALDKLFNDDTNTIGKGVTNFYKYVINKYINIKREDVNQYLQTKGYFQLTRNISKRTNKPIVAKYLNQSWAIDLIDMNDIIASNRGWRYIMTVADIFSRKVFLNKIKNKDAIDARNAFNEIIDENGISPKYLLSDNGNEWLGEFQDYCKDNNIKQLFTRSYSPEANGVVERMNKEIRKIMKAFFVRNGNKAWYNILDKIADNKNATYNSSVKNSPNEIWSPDNREYTRATLPQNDPKYQAKKSLMKKAIEKIKKFKEEDNFKVDDLVRVKMSSIFANVRKLVKDKKTKQIVVTYTPDVFYVKKVIVPRNKLLERKKYVLENIDDKVLTKNGTAQMFYASELLLFTAEDNLDIQVDMDEALKLNGVERNANDVDY